MDGEAAAQARIEKWRGWKSTPEHPYPSFRSKEHHELDDLAAILAGSKPAAFIGSFLFNARQRSEFEALLRMARKQGLAIEDDWNPEPEAEGNYRLYIGKPENIEGLKYYFQSKGYRGLKSGGMNSAEEAYNFYRLLGYDEKAVKERFADTDWSYTFPTDAERKAEGKAWWEQLPKYKKLGYMVRRQLDIAKGRIHVRRYDKTVETLDRVMREPMPKENLGHSSAASSHDATAKKKGNEGR